MPTVIDSLIVTLGLDPSQFVKAQKDAATAFLKTRDEALKTGTQIERSGNKAADAVGRVRNEALALFAVLMGARGVKEFFGDLTSANAALGRFSQNLAESPQRVSGWQAAVQRVGGTAEGFRSTMEGVSKALNDFHTTGAALPPALFRLEALTGRNIDTNNGIDKYLQDLAAALQKLNATNPQQAHFLAQGLGLDDATARVMMNNGAAVTSYVDALGKMVGPSGDAIKASEDLQSSFAALKQEVQKVGNEALTPLSKALKPVIDDMDDWIAQNQDWIDSEITDDVKALKEWLEKIDWKAIGTDIKAFTTDANAAAAAVGGWAHVIEGLTAAWAAWKAVQVVATARTALGGAASAGGGLPYQIGAGIGTAIGGAATYGLAEGAEKEHILDDPRVAGDTTAESVLRFLDPKLPGLLGYGNAKGQGPAGESNAGTLTSIGGALSNLLGISSARADEGVKVQGAEVSRANPLPVTAIGGNTDVTGRGIGGSTGSGLTPGGGGGAVTPGSGGGSTTPTGGSAGTPGWWTAERQAHAVDRLVKEAGLSQYGAKGLVSRWANVESSGGPASSNNIGGGHYGIGQWSRNDRAVGIWGNPDFDAQLTHAVADLKKQGQAAAYYKLKAAQTDAEGAIGASMYERAEGYNPQTGIDNYTNRTLGGMRGMDAVLERGRRQATGTTPSAMSFGATGAAGAAAVNHIANDNSTSTTSNSHEVHIGSMSVNAPNATDADGVAQSMQGAIGRTFLASGANYGLR